MSNDSKSRFALGAVIGAAAGIIAGILTAPKAGKETRADLRERAMELKGDASRRSQDVKQRAQETAGNAKEKADDLKKRSTRAIEAARREFTNEE